MAELILVGIGTIFIFSIGSIRGYLARLLPAKIFYLRMEKRQTNIE